MNPKPYLLIRLSKGGGAQLVEAYESREKADADAKEENRQGEKHSLPWRAIVTERGRIESNRKA